MNDTLLGIKQIAEQLGYSEKTVRRKFIEKKLPGAFQAGRGSRIKMPESALKKLKGEK